MITDEAIARLRRELDRGNHFDWDDSHQLLDSVARLKKALKEAVDIAIEWGGLSEVDEKRIRELVGE